MPRRLTVPQAWRAIAAHIVALPNKEGIGYFLCNRIDALYDAGCITREAYHAMHRQVVEAAGFDPEHGKRLVGPAFSDEAGDANGRWFDTPSLERESPEWVNDADSKRVRVLAALLLAEQARRP